MPTPSSRSPRVAVRGTAKPVRGKRVTDAVHTSTWQACLLTQAAGAGTLARVGELGREGNLRRTLRGVSWTMSRRFWRNPANGFRSPACTVVTQVPTHLRPERGTG